MKAPTVAQRTRAAYEVLPAPQRLVFEVASNYECELAQEYRHFDRRGIPWRRAAGGAGCITTIIAPASKSKGSLASLP